MKKGKLYCILGTSGAGKGTLRKNLIQMNIPHLLFAKSYVTRKMREGEVEGDVYYFISEKKFNLMIEKNEFLEYEKVHQSAYYGTRFSDVYDNGILRGTNMFKELDIEGLKNIYTHHGELKKDITSIFLGLSEEKFGERIAARGIYMGKNEYNNRLLSLRKEMNEAESVCDYFIDTSNKTPKEVLQEVLNILE